MKRRLDGGEGTQRDRSSRVGQETGKGAQRVSGKGPLGRALGPRNALRFGGISDQEGALGWGGGLNYGRGRRMLVSLSPN